MKRRRPLTTAANLRQFAKKATGARGAKKARRAARYVLDGSASPAETSLAMMLTLPYKLGGYALPRPSLNHPVGSFRCDLAWPEHHIVVEYDSSQEHSSEAALEHDSQRRNALTANETVLTATNKQLRYLDLTDLMARFLAKRLGKRINPRLSDYPNRQNELRRSLNSAHKTSWLRGPRQEWWEQ